MKFFRKIALLFILGLFLAFTIGVPLNKHYCGSELYSAGIVLDDCCCEETASMKDNCCTTESNYYNINQEYEANSAQKIKLDLAVISVPMHWCDSKLALVYYTSESPVPAIAFPPKKVPLYKLLQEYTVYG